MDTELILNNQVKHLGVILNSKLNWKFHIENRIRKASVAYLQCHREIGKTWSLKPKTSVLDIHFCNKTDVDICRISLVEKNTSDDCKKTVWSYPADYLIGYDRLYIV
jgi:hypothetical protein